MKTEFKWYSTNKKYLEIVFCLYVSRRTLSRWLSKNDEYVKLKNELRKKMKEGNKIFRKIKRKAINYIKKRYPNAVILETYIGFPRSGNVYKKRLIVEFREDKDKFFGYHIWSFGGRRLPEIKDDVLKLVELYYDIEKINRKLSNIKEKVIKEKLNGKRVKLCF